MIDARDVTAVIPTRGNVDLAQILDTLVFAEVVVWDNAERSRDLGAYGRYAAALGEVKTAVVYTQDDDCLITPASQRGLLDEYEDGLWLSNMPADWNGNGMPWLALPGWGALFNVALIQSAVARWDSAYPQDFASDDFRRIGCDIVIPVLCPSRMIDLGHENLPHAEDAARTCKRGDYQAKKRWYYKTASELRR